MSKRIARQRKKRAAKPEQHWVKRKSVIIICALLMLTLAIGIMAQWKMLPGISKPLTLTPAPSGSLAANSPSKEYIYAGGRLIATEEPAATPTPTPPPSSSTENVFWTNFVGSSATANTLTKSAGANSWDSGASSTRAIASGDGYVEFSVGSVSDHKMCGLSFGDDNAGYSDIDFAIYGDYLGHIYIYEGGLQVGGGSLGSYTTGDRLRVAISGSNVQYLKNGTLLYEHAATINYPLRVDTSLYTPNSQITNAVISGNLINLLPTQNVVWTNVTTNASVSGNNLTKLTTASNGWDAGAVSTKAIASGDGYVEFSVNEANKHKMCGLSNGDSNASYSDIDYAVYLDYLGQIYIYEDGTQIGNSLGSYATGDSFRVSVEGGAVKYWKKAVGQTNWTWLYTSTAAPTYPLLVDTSIYSPGAAINNVIISGTLTP